MGVSGLAVMIPGPDKTASQRRDKAKRYCEQALDALRVADCHLEAIHSAEAARLSGDVKRQVRELGNVIKAFPK